ncbi:hypothetical protein [Streptomyces sp. MUM 178J]|uniref:hypothetical protein n=1 Tax=Streptomyces sp. MUM 178J TaxID=2791991 RepID=UPI001F0425BE|nr:hypothetical protein [Streptomyces sp. MUM 178J]WRQ78052.1 hypothetical protein I3F59_000870 [Streptomyces sp. MUM 178J]
MRVMLRAQLDTEKSTEALQQGRLAKIMMELMDQLQPEAAYFGPSDGNRSCTFVFDMQDSWRLPGIAEPLLSGLGARIEIQPVMNAEDMQKGLAAIQR